MFENLEDIKKLRLRLDFTQEELAKQLGVSKQYINLIEKGKKRFAKDKIEILKQLTLDILGEDLNEKIVEINFYPNTFASCNSGSYVLAEQREIKRVSSIFIPNYSAEKEYSICTARGDSMYPTIKNGNYVIVQHHQNEQLIDNDIYIFCYRDELYLKRLSKNINELIIASDNKEYGQIIVSSSELEHVNIIGRIVGVLYT